MKRSERRIADAPAAKSGRGSEQYAISIKSIYLFLEGDFSINVTANFSSVSEARDFAIRHMTLVGIYDLSVVRLRSKYVIRETVQING